MFQVKKPNKKTSNQVTSFCIFIQGLNPATFVLYAKPLNMLCFLLQVIILIIWKNKNKTNFSINFIEPAWPHPRSQFFFTMVAIKTTP